MSESIHSNKFKQRAEEEMSRSKQETNNWCGWQSKMQKWKSGRRKEMQLSDKDKTNRCSIISNTTEWTAWTTTWCNNFQWITLINLCLVQSSHNSLYLNLEIKNQIHPVEQSQAPLLKSMVTNLEPKKILML